MEIIKELVTTFLGDRLINIAEFNLQMQQNSD